MGGSEWHRAGVPVGPAEGATQCVDLAGLGRILLVRSGGHLYATQQNCGHMRMPLCDGKVDGTLLTCPLHKARFDLRTGVPVRGPRVPGLFARTKLGRGILAVPTDPLQTFDVEMRPDGLYLRRKA
ncbi:MAG: Rieske (2Fe-2S) protein [Thermoplasmata archaeon]